MSSEATKREPSPQPGKQDVVPEVIKDLEERSEMGRKAYGTVLQTHNQRKALVDAYQEALDLCVYLKQYLMEQKTK